MSQNRRVARARLRARRPRRLGRRRLRALPHAARPDLHQLLRRQRDGQLHAGLSPAASARSRRAGRDLRRASGSRSPRCCRSRGMTARPAVRESVPGYLFAGSTLGARRRSVPRLRVVLPAEAGVRAVPDHVCRRDRAVSRVRRGDRHSHDVTAPPCRRSDLQGARSTARWRSRWRCCSLGGAASTLAFFPREGAVRPRPPAPATRPRRRRARTSGPSSSASWRAPRGAARRSRPTAPRC